MPRFKGDKSKGLADDVLRKGMKLFKKGDKGGKALPDEVLAPTPTPTSTPTPTPIPTPTPTPTPTGAGCFSSSLIAPTPHHPDTSEREKTDGQ